MIPRPRTEAAARHDPGRWICNRRPENCDGAFRVYGQDMPCPLRAKCYWGRRNTYQWTPGQKQWGRYPALDVDVDWRRVHGTRLAALRRLWGPARTWRASDAQREEYNARQREKRRAAADSLGIRDPPMDRQPLPCGEDCEHGCPYDDACPYSDDAVEALETQAAKERAKAVDRRKRAREKAREAADPAYRAHRRELDRLRCQRYREAHKDVLRAKARERYHNQKKG